MNIRSAISVLCQLLLVGCIVPTSGATANAREAVIRNGDWIVNGRESHRGEQIHLKGNLILPTGSELTLEHCTLEIVGEYSREHSVEWKGGTLVTRNCTLGGFVNESGTAIHTVFHLYNLVPDSKVITALNVCM